MCVYVCMYRELVLLLGAIGEVSRVVQDTLTAEKSKAGQNLHPTGTHIHTHALIHIYILAFKYTYIRFIGVDRKLCHTYVLCVCMVGFVCDVYVMLCMYVCIYVCMCKMTTMTTSLRASRSSPPPSEPEMPSTGPRWARETSESST